MSVGLFYLVVFAGLAGLFGAVMLTAWIVAHVEEQARKDREKALRLAEQRSADELREQMSDEELMLTINELTAAGEKILEQERKKCA